MQTITQNLSAIPRSPHFSGKACLLDITTEGRYWRTSRLISASVICLEEGEAVLRTWISEKEADEYDILYALKDLLREMQPLYTFNGTSFDLPHLAKKFAAYRLPDPVTGKDHHDLYLELKPLNALLPIKSHRLADYLGCLPALNPEIQAGISPEALQGDACGTLYLTRLLDFMDFLSGSFTVRTAIPSPESLVITLVPEKPLPLSLTVADGPFTLKVTHEEAELTAVVYDGKLRRYYTNISDYDYLPLEGCAVHRSVSAYVAKSRKEKAVRDNCFTLVPCTKAFAGDANALRKYAVSVLAFLLTRPQES